MPPTQHDDDLGAEPATVEVSARTVGPPLEQGTTLGRYAVLERIGSGGMGEVVRAYDPKLHREVALKRLRAGALDPEAEARLLREAQAMAQLSHPHVVQVFDVDRTDEGVVMAMELVEGQTLAKWLKTDPPRDEILRRFIEAGRALEAAHAAGLVHRDFKPGNVMCGRDGRVKVLDFGLARAAQLVELAEPSTDEAGPDDEADSLSTPLTRAGAVMGTPAYMAPEQHLGEAPDARSDQYAFCAALWEALYGQRPFSGGLVQVVFAKRSGPPTPPTRGRVPSWLHAILHRGLQPEPADRWPSMTVVLELLSHDPVRTRNRRIAVGVGALALLGVGAALSRMSTTTTMVAAPDDAAPVCPDARAGLDGVWTETERDAVARALGSRAELYAEATTTHVLEHLDDYADAWVASKQDACEATHVRGEQSAEMLDLRVACLHRRRTSLAAVVDVFREADATVLEKAGDVLGGLPTISACDDTDALREAVPAPETPELAAEVEAVRKDVARGRVLSEAGKHAEANVVLAPLLDRARASGYPLLVAETLGSFGWNEALAGRQESAEAALREAFDAAITVGADMLAVELASDLAADIGYTQGRLEPARVWADIATALAHRTGDSSREAMASNVRGGLANRTSEFSEAVVDLERAVALFAELDDYPNHLAIALGHLGIALDELQRFSEAQEKFREAIAIEEAIYGTEHPAVLSMLANLAISLGMAGQREEARPILERVLDLRQRLLGKEHPATALSHVNLGWNFMESGRATEALEQFEAARRIFIATLGVDNSNVGMAAEGVGTAQLDLGDLDAAEAAFRQSLEVRKIALGPDHPYVALSLSSLASVEDRRGRHTAALAGFDEALALLGDKGEDGQRFVSDVRHQRAECLLALERWDAAIADFEVALELRSGEHDPGMRAKARFGLAKALVGKGELARAREQARQARAEFGTSSEPAGEATIAEIDTFLADHPAP